MAEISLKYGKAQLSCLFPGDVPVQWILPPSVKASADSALLVRESFSSALGNIHTEILGANTTVAIAVNDKTRPVPHPVLLPPMLDWLHQYGIVDKNITFYIASGTHEPMAHAEISDIIPDEVVSKYPVIAHNCLDKPALKYLGLTSTNHTPVWVNKSFAEADYRIVVGNIEPHHFMGFSGGVKTAAIGLTGMETIQKNHALMIQPNCTTARVVDNPMRQDVEEIGRMIGIHLALNAVLNGNRQIVSVHTGEPQAVFEAGMRKSIEVCQTAVPGTFDMVIASAGGYPKDINFYQAQKAMSNAAMITRDKGCLILAAECIEGAGSEGFTEFMYGSTSAADVMQRFSHSPFAIGMHKAFLTCRILEKMSVVLVSSLAPEIVRSWHMIPAGSLQDALNIASSLISHPNACIAVMPYAVNTIPLVPAA